MSLPAAPGVVSPPLSADVASSLRERARLALAKALADETNWVRVHAAEALIAMGEGALARATYERELLALEAGPARVGAWRILAATARSATERAMWIRKITEVLAKPGAADRLQAVESLCKLRAPITGVALTHAQEMSAGLEPERPLGDWALHLTGDASAVGRLIAALNSSDPVVRLRASYALRWIGLTDSAALKTLAARVDTEPVDSLARPYILSAALVLRAAPARHEAWLRLAEEVLEHGAPGPRYELSQTVPERTVRIDVSRTMAAAERATGDERIGAALLVARIIQPPPPAAPRSP